jgi:crotonobetainyl-CoA:carnitine CoA-transferase CaiB-like acyl-CoA transferase
VVAAVAARIAARPAAYWRSAFDQADRCCTVAVTLGEAMADSDFRARVLERYSVDDAETGARLHMVHWPWRLNSDPMASVTAQPSESNPSRSHGRTNRPRLATE